MLNLFLGSLFVVLSFGVLPAVAEESFPRTASVAIELHNNEVFAAQIGTLDLYVDEGDEEGRGRESIGKVTLFFLDGKGETGAFIWQLKASATAIQEAYYYQITYEANTGVRFTGTVDLRNPLKPLVNLSSESGQSLVNMSEAGKQFKAEHLEDIFLGS